MDGKMMQAIPEERMLVATAVLAQDEIKRRWSLLTPRMQQFLKFRLMLGTDAAAMHMFGKTRRDGDMQKKCLCGYHEPGWIDMRGATLVGWKHQENFKFVYDFALNEPLLYSATRMEQLAPAAISTYEQILGPESDAKPSVRRLAAKDVMQANGLLQVEGTHGKPQSGVQTSIMLTIARERLMRGLDLSDGQRVALEAAGIHVPQQAPKLALGVGQRFERTLDGEDVIEGSFGDNPDDLIPD